MNFEMQLRIATNIFEKKIRQARTEYSRRNSGNIVKSKMNNYVNRKLKNDINFLLAANIYGPLRYIS